MTLEKINSKRLTVTLLSLTATIILVALFAISLIFFSSLAYVWIGGIIILLSLLYCLSEFYVKKEYKKIKASIVELAIKKDVKCNKIVYNNKPAEFIYHFYHKNYVNIKSSMDFIYNDDIISLKEFELITKRNFRSDKVVLAGKHLQMAFPDKTIDCVLILNHNDETRKFLDYYSFYYKNQKRQSSPNGDKEYIKMFNDEVKMPLLNVFEKMNSFHVIAIKDGTIDVLFIDKMEIFDFKLQNKLNNLAINKCSVCFEKAVKIINTLRKELDYVQKNSMSN